MGAIANVLARIGASDESGQTLTEYALIIALVVIVVITVLGLFGTQLNGLFQDISTQVASVAP